MTEPWQAAERHSLATSVALHLAPGALLAIVFLLLAPAVNRAGGSSYLAILLCIPLVLVPFEVGVLLVARTRLGCSLGSFAVLRGSQPLSVPASLLSVAVLYALAMLAAAAVSPLRTAALRAVTGWLPQWPVIGELPAGISQGTLWLGLALSGVVAPVAEELYFRGYLMPRIPVAGAWAPAANAALFSIYHFYTPWNWVPIFAAFLPLVYYVRLRGRLLPVIVTHCMFNSLGVLAALVGRA